MATRQREPISPRWPSVATSASLPNVAGSPTQSAYLQVGDECYAYGDGALYVCVVATLGAAVWLVVATASHAALSVVGRSANSTGDVADIAAANDGEVLRRSGTSIGFGTIATAGIADGAVTGAKLAQSGTLDIGAASITTTGTIDGRDVSADGAALDQLKLGVPASTVQTISSGTSGTVSAGVRTVLIATGSGNFTLTMRAYNDGDELTIIKTSTDANSITIDRPGGAGTFNGASASLVLAGSTSTVGYVAWTYRVVGASAAVVV
jgi:hypothetical protein